jgi:tRNA A-37 threonylcarbamoyl transferase component Bud32
MGQFVSVTLAYLSINPSTTTYVGNTRTLSFTVNSGLGYTENTVLSQACGTAGGRCHFNFSTASSSRYSTCCSSSADGSQCALVAPSVVLFRFTPPSGVTNVVGRVNSDASKCTIIPNSCAVANPIYQTYQYALRDQAAAAADPEDTAALSAQWGVPVADQETIENERRQSIYVYNPTILVPAQLCYPAYLLCNFSMSKPVSSSTVSVDMKFTAISQYTLDFSVTVEDRDTFGTATTCGAANNNAWRCNCGLQKTRVKRVVDVTCPANQVVLPGATSCSACPVGQQPNAQLNGCTSSPVVCLRGQYNTGLSGNLTCAECAPGFIVNANGTGCTPCGPLQIRQPTTCGATDGLGCPNQCVTCPFGQVPDAGAFSCQNCPSPDTQIINVSTTPARCTNCPPDSYAFAGACVSLTFEDPMQTFPQSTDSALVADPEKSSSDNTALIAVYVVVSVVCCLLILLVLGAVAMRRRRQLRESTRSSAGSFGQQMPNLSGQVNVDAVIRATNARTSMAANDPATYGAVAVAPAYGVAAAAAPAYGAAPPTLSQPGYGMAQAGVYGGPSAQMYVVPSAGGSNSLGGGSRSVNTTASSFVKYGNANAAINLPKESVIAYESLFVEQEVGRGSFGVVFRGVWNGQKCAIKQLLEQGQYMSAKKGAKQLQELENEGRLMLKLSAHPNVVTLFGICLNPVALVTEFLTGGCLEKVLLDPTQQVPTAYMMRFCRDIVTGLQHLHKFGIVHRDLATRNVLLDEHWNCKIADFGMSRQHDGESGQQHNYTQSNVGPLKWMAPEAIQKQVYSVATDVYALGVTFAEIFNRTDPYPSMSPVQVAVEVIQKGTRPNVPDWLPTEISECMWKMYDTDPRSRPSLDEVLVSVNMASKLV